MNTPQAIKVPNATIDAITAALNAGHAMGYESALSAQQQPKPLGGEMPGSLPQGELQLDCLVQVGKLGVAVRMPAALQRLPIGLQTVAQFMEQLRHDPMAGLVPLAPQFLRQLPHALAGPPQG